MNDLYKFYQYYVINTFNKEVIPAPHIKKLSRALMRMYRGAYNKMTVSLPPRHSKSSLITLAFPLWLICNDPSLNIMIINSTSTLSKSFGIRIRELFNRYSNDFGLQISDDKHASDWIMFKYPNGELTGGSIRLIGIGGQITGFDADWIIVDDLVKGVSDCTPTALDTTKEYFDGVITQRIEPHTKLIVLGTIWHSDDILSYLRNEHGDEYKIIDMPAYDANGNVLWSNRYDKEFFDKREKEMGTRLFQALYMCHPLDMTGSFFNTDSLRFEEHTRTNYTYSQTVRSWDLAYSDESKGQVNDSTASCLMTRTLDNQYIIHEVINEQYGDKLKNVLRSTAYLDTPNIPILIETGTTGGAAEFLYKEYCDNYLQGYNTKQSKPIGSKVDRATPFRDAILDGRIIIDLPDHQREQLIRQLQSFPLGKHDDIIDAISYAYNYLSTKNSGDIIATGHKRRRFKI